jgi:hypothetical protein
MAALIISVRVNRGLDIPRFQRPALNIQRSWPNEEKREEKKPNAEHRTPNGIWESDKGKRPTSNTQRPTSNVENREIIWIFSQAELSPRLFQFFQPNFSVCERSLCATRLLLLYHGCHKAMFRNGEFGRRDGWSLAYPEKHQPVE